MARFIRYLFVLLVFNSWIQRAPMAADDGEIPEQVQALSSEDADVRLDALNALRDMGVAARGAQSALIGLLDDPDERVRAAAADVLLRLGGDINLVLPLLEDPEQFVQLAVARSLLVDGRKPEAAIPALIFLASDSQSFMDIDAEETFEAFSPRLARRMAPVLLEIIRTEDASRIRFHAYDGLQKMDAIGPEHVPLLLSLLRHPKDDIREMAAERLAWLQKDAESAIPALRAALEDRDPAVRVQAALALLSFDATRDMAIEVLRSIMDDGPPDARLLAADGLRFNPAPELISQLIEALGDPERDSLSSSSQEALSAMGPDIVPDLLATVAMRDEGVSDDYQWDGVAQLLLEFSSQAPVDEVTQALVALSYREAQMDAAFALGHVAAENKSATARLIEMLRSPFVNVRRVAAEALQSTTPRADAGATRTVLRDLLLHDDDPHVRVAAARSLGRLGEDATVYLPVLEELLEDEDGRVVEDVLNAYEELGSLGAPSIPKLVRALNTDASVVNWVAFHQLYQIVPRAFGAIGAAAVPALVNVLDDPDPLVRGHAAESLGLIGPDAAPAVPALVKHLSDEGQWTAWVGDKGFRQTVGGLTAEALGKIGPAAKEAVPDLVQRLEVIKQDDLYPKDAAIRVQALSAEALGRIGPDAASAVPALWKVVENAKWWEPTEALAALARIQPGNARVVEGLRKFLLQLQRDDPLAEQHSVTAIGSLGDAIVEMGDAGRALIPTLKYLIQDAPLLEPLYRCDAAYTLARIDPDNPLPERFLRREARIEQVIGIFDWAQETLETLHDDAGRQAAEGESTER
jgi:HEAT repeat protein